MSSTSSTATMSDNKPPLREMFASSSRWNEGGHMTAKIQCEMTTKKKRSIERFKD